MLQHVVVRHLCTQRIKDWCFGGCNGIAMRWWGLILDNGVHGYHRYPSMEQPWWSSVFGFSWLGGCVDFSTGDTYVLLIVSAGIYYGVCAGFARLNP